MSWNEFYDSKTDALLDLIRFGPGVMSVSEFMVMLFHVEQFVSFDPEDEHDYVKECHVLNGCYQFKWARREPYPSDVTMDRGPCGGGVSSAKTWRATNEALRAKGFLHFEGTVDADWMIYTVQWGGLVKAFLAFKWERSAREQARMIAATKLQLCEPAQEANP